MTNLKLSRIVYFSFFFVSMGVFVSVTIPSGFHIIAAAPLTYFSWKYLVDDKRSLPKSSWALLLFVLASYASNFANLGDLIKPLSAFGKQKYEVFGVMTLMGLFYMREYMGAFRWRKILNVFFFTIVAAAFYGVFKVLTQIDLFTMSQAVGGDELARAGGFTEVMRYAYGTSFVLSMMLACIPFLKKDGVFNKKWFWTALVFGVIGLYFSKARGAILGLFVSIPVILWFVRKKWSYIAIALGVVGIAGVVVLGAMGGTGNRLVSKLGYSSNLKRVSQYETAFKTFLEKPVFGHGVNQFSHICPNQKGKYEIYWPAYCQEYKFLNCSYPNESAYCGHSHNVFLEYATNRGLLGLVTFCAFLLLWGVEMWRRQDAMTVVILALLANFVVASQFEFTLNANNSFMFFLLYAVSSLPLPRRFKLDRSRE